MGMVQFSLPCALFLSAKLNKLAVKTIAKFQSVLTDSLLQFLPT
jgi:hypothetical protein